ncbi:MAG: tripartite tricarboxylate transporter substrate binding protein [Ideonella sp.]|nr:tripartite tricarboxylate transporter substrate binding protein [Ideonella sp.]MCC7455815.1 tripartite tricarboxylate transporter substrate binding protein [Nitrospira sp.]
MSHRFDRPGRTPRRLFGACLLALAATPLAFAQTPASRAATAWPTKPVKILVGFPGGSTPDVAARILADGLARSLGQTVLVENRPGASGNIAADQVAKATDDHTFGLVINGNLSSAKLLNPKLPFDPAKDFSFLSLVAGAPLVLVTQPDKPSGADFFLAARNAGAKWNYGSVGIGSVGHLGMELLKSRAGNFGATHVPYQGNPAVIKALLTDEVQMSLIPPGLALPQINAGKLKAVGLTTGRSTLAPGIPPLADAGVRGYDLDVFVALVGPAKLSPAARTRMAAEASAVARSSEMRQRFFNAGWAPVGGSPEALRTRVRNETSLLGGIIMMRGIKLQ